MSERGQAGKTTKKAVSKSNKACLVFPVGRVARYLKDGRYSSRVGVTAPVYLAAVLEYLTAELVELAGELCHQRKKIRITPRHIQLVVRTDQELAQIFKRVTISSGGVVPGVHPFVLPKKKAATKRRRGKQKTPSSSVE